MKAQARHTTGTMNKTEAAYEQHLALRVKAGEIQSYMFEPMSLRLGKSCFYMPDFMVVTIEGFVAFHEVKGFWREDARVKIKVAAAKFPMFVFLAVQRSKRSRNGWTTEVF